MHKLWCLLNFLFFALLIPVWFLAIDAPRIVLAKNHPAPKKIRLSERIAVSFSLGLLVLVPYFAKFLGYGLKGQLGSLVFYLLLLGCALAVIAWLLDKPTVKFKAS